MPPIYHLATPEAWATHPAEDYRAASLESEGFIHCSSAHQVAWAANRFCRDAAALLVLEIETARLTSPLRIEPAGSGEEFPHVYGPINRSAVVAVVPLTRGSAGEWLFEKGAGQGGTV
jgi:uncharacterized protein (DUF952 family)